MKYLFHTMISTLFLLTSVTLTNADMPTASALSPDYTLVDTTHEELDSLIAAAHLEKAKRALQRIRDGKSPELSKRDLDEHLLKYQRLIGRKGM
jgi:hypothetical protein